MGKTRLAVEMGRRLSGEFARGVAFVDLSPIRDPSRVAPALAAGGRLVEQTAPTLWSPSTASAPTRRPPSWSPSGRTPAA